VSGDSHSAGNEGTYPVSTGHIGLTSEIEVLACLVLYSFPTCLHPIWNNSKFDNFRRYCDNAVGPSPWTTGQSFGASNTVIARLLTGVAHLVARTNKNVAHPRIDAIHRDWAGDRPWTGRQAQTIAWLRLKRSQDRPLLQCDPSIDRPAVFRAEQLRGGSSYVAPINTENLLHVLQSAQFCRSDSEQNAIRTESYWSEARIRMNGWLRVRRACVLFRPRQAKLSRLQYPLQDL